MALLSFRYFTVFNFFKGTHFIAHRFSVWFSSNPFLFISSLRCAYNLVNIGPLEWIYLLPPNQDLLFPFSVHLGTTLSSTSHSQLQEQSRPKPINIQHPPLPDIVISLKTPTWTWRANEKKWSFPRGLRKNLCFPSWTQTRKGGWRGWGLLSPCCHVVPAMKPMQQSTVQKRQQEYSLVLTASPVQKARSISGHYNYVSKQITFFFKVIQLRISFTFN